MDHFKVFFGLKHKSNNSKYGFRIFILNSGCRELLIYLSDIITPVFRPALDVLSVKIFFLQICQRERRRILCFFADANVGSIRFFVNTRREPVFKFCCLINIE